MWIIAALGRRGVFIRPTALRKVARGDASTVSATQFVCQYP